MKKNRIITLQEIDMVSGGGARCWCTKNDCGGNSACPKPKSKPYYTENKPACINQCCYYDRANSWQFGNGSYKYPIENGTCPPNPVRLSESGCSIM